MVLSDRTIARLLGEGRIEIDPYDETLLQPSSVDVRVDRYFRVFHNARYPFIDVKQPQEDLTELVEVDGERPFILHPAHLRVPEGPIVGAAAVHAVLSSWRQTLQREDAPLATPSAPVRN